MIRTVSRPLIGHKGADNGLWLVEDVCHRSHNCGNILNDQFHTSAHILHRPCSLWLISKLFPTICQHLGGGLLNIFGLIWIFLDNPPVAWSAMKVIMEPIMNRASTIRNLSISAIAEIQSVSFCHYLWSLLFLLFIFDPILTEPFSRQIFWDISPKNNYQLSDIFHILDIKYSQGPGSV